MQLDNIKEREKKLSRLICITIVLNPPIYNFLKFITYLLSVNLYIFIRDRIESLCTIYVHIFLFHFVIH